MKRAVERPYHHGDLRRALLDAAIAEIEARGPAGLSLREVARRAGVSHAAPTHHFGDKAGIFTAIAVDGFHLLTDATRTAAVGDEALLLGGLAYIRFAVTHRAHFEVMFRPDLLRADDPELLAARDAGFEVLFQAVGAARPTAGPADVLATAIAAWSQAHGFALLWINGNLPEGLTTDLVGIASLVAGGVVQLGEVTREQMTGALEHLAG